MENFKKFEKHIYENIIPSLKENNEAKNQHETDMMLENQKDTLNMILMVLSEYNKWKKNNN